MFKIAAKNCPLVLDLNYRGFGLSAECLEWGGELLAVKDPVIPQGDHVPGARVQTGSAQNIVRALRAARLRFPFVVASVLPTDVGWVNSPPTSPIRGLLGWSLAGDTPAPRDRLQDILGAMIAVMAADGLGVVEYAASRSAPPFPADCRVISEAPTRNGGTAVAFAKTGEWAPDWRGDRAENAELVLAFRALKPDQQKESSDPVFGRAILA